MTRTYKSKEKRTESLSMHDCMKHVEEVNWEIQTAVNDFVIKHPTMDEETRSTMQLIFRKLLEQRNFASCVKEAN